MRKSILLVALALALGGQTVLAVEITPVVGYRIGGPSYELVEICPFPTLIPCPEVEVETEDSAVFGLIVDVPITDGWQAEVLLNRQETEQEVTIRFGRLPFPIPFPVDGRFTVDFELTTLHVGILREWELARARPFVGVGAGLTQLELGDEGLGVADDERFSGSVAGGAKVPVSDRFGLRFEARGYWVDAPEEIGGSFTQVEATVGASFRW
ncbi:MAG TPA: outer membrane beta-barrel protein [Thermoanaerobaculia bacterium]|nr:outer membrane beta-barrel protein [Thermoanaerobaculia bacterium]